MKKVKKYIWGIMKEKLSSSTQILIVNIVYFVMLYEDNLKCHLVSKTTLNASYSYQNIISDYEVESEGFYFFQTFLCLFILPWQCKKLIWEKWVKTELWAHPRKDFFNTNDFFKKHVLACLDLGKWKPVFCHILPDLKDVLI